MDGRWDLGVGCLRSGMGFIHWDCEKLGMGVWRIVYNMTYFKQIECSSMTESGLHSRNNYPRGPRS